MKIEYVKEREGKLLPHQRIADMNFKNEFRQNMEAKSAFLNLTLYGMELYLERGLEEYKEMKEKKDLALNQADPFYDFVEACLEVTNNPDDVLSSEDLYDAFTGYCMSNSMNIWKPASFAKCFSMKAMSKSGPIPKPDSSLITFKKNGRNVRGRGRRGVKLTESGLYYLEERQIGKGKLSRLSDKSSPAPDGVEF